VRVEGLIAEVARQVGYVVIVGTVSHHHQIHLGHVWKKTFGTAPGLIARSDFGVYRAEVAQGRVHATHVLE
jgi:hypothetical protein